MTSNARGEVATMAATPAAAKTECTNIAKEIPTDAQRAGRGPSVTPVATMNATSGPGVTSKTKDTARKTGSTEISNGMTSPQSLQLLSCFGSILIVFNWITMNVEYTPKF
jgi:hypothetical protein